MHTVKDILKWSSAYLKKSSVCNVRKLFGGLSLSLFRCLSLKLECCADGYAVWLMGFVSLQICTIYISLIEIEREEEDCYCD